ncbi:meiotic PUF protein 1 [Tilletia horrida]|nr:meiotic PUF protein 1 [Tilletia horrida]
MTQQEPNSLPTYHLGTMSVSAPPTRQPPHTSRFAPFDSPEQEEAAELGFEGLLEPPPVKPGRNRSQTTTPIATHAQAHLLEDNVLTATQSSPMHARHVDLIHGGGLLDLDEAERRLLQHQEHHSTGHCTPALSTSSSASIPSIDSTGSLSRHLRANLESPTPSPRALAGLIGSAHLSLPGADDTATGRQAKSGLYRHPFARLSGAVDGLIGSYPSSSADSRSSTSSSLSGSPRSDQIQSVSAATGARKRSLTDRANLAGRPFGDDRSGSSPTAVGQNDKNTSGQTGSSPHSSPGHQLHHQSSKSLSHLGKLHVEADIFGSSPSLFGPCDPFSSPNFVPMGRHPSFHLAIPSSLEQDGTGAQTPDLGSSSLEPDSTDASFVSADEVPKPIGTQPGDQLRSAYQVADNSTGEESAFNSDPASISSSTLLSDRSTSYIDRIPKAQTQIQEVATTATAGPAQTPSRLASKHRPPPLTLHRQSVALPPPPHTGSTTQGGSPFVPTFLLSPFGTGPMGAHENSFMNPMGGPTPPGQLGAQFGPLAALGGAGANLQQLGWAQLPLGPHGGNPAEATADMHLGRGPGGQAQHVRQDGPVSAPLAGPAAVTAAACMPALAHLPPSAATMHNMRAQSLGHPPVSAGFAPGSLGVDMATGAGMHPFAFGSAGHVPLAAAAAAAAAGAALRARGGMPMTTPVTPVEPNLASGWPFDMAHGAGADFAGPEKLFGGLSSSAGNLMPGSAVDSARVQQLAAQLQARDSAVDILQRHIDRLNAQLVSLSVAAEGGPTPPGGATSTDSNHGSIHGLSTSEVGGGGGAMGVPIPTPTGLVRGAAEGMDGAYARFADGSAPLSAIAAARRDSSPQGQGHAYGHGQGFAPGLNAAAPPFRITSSSSSGSMASSLSSSIHAAQSDSDTDSNAQRNTGDQYIGPKVLVERALGPRNQEATIVLQQQLKSATPERKQAIVNAIAPHSLKLAFDKHGNFLLQRAITACPQLAWQLKGSFVQLSLSPYGCHVVQKILDEGEEYRVAVVKEMLENRLAETLTSRNSIHVWQKLLEINWTSREFRKSIFRTINDTMRGTWARTAVQETGSIICQNVFESADAEDRQECIAEVLGSLRECAMDQYGVWVAQHLVEHGDREHRRAAMDKLLEDAVTLTLSQYGQKAIMSALRTNDEIFLRRYVDILCGQEATGGASSRRSVLVEIGSAPQGLQIVTQLLTSVTPAQREKIIQTVRRNSVFLKGSKTGLKVHQLCERARAFTGY